MKYVILVGDGMGDYPLPLLKDRTPLEAAPTPNLDHMASKGLLGLAQTIPTDRDPGSDVANMSILGYDPSLYHTGRAPLEAASLNVELAADDVAFRLNLVNLEFLPSGRIIMRDHAAGNITTEEAREILADLDESLPRPGSWRLYPGVSYRHLLVIPGISDQLPTIAPHDHRDEAVNAYLNQSGGIAPILQLIRDSWAILRNHPVNIQRVKKGLLPANSVWPWGQGKKPLLPTFKERFNLTGSVVSAVDLLKGIGVYAGLTPLSVAGVTGLNNTNFEGKVQAGLKALESSDFLLLHLEAPDEASHQGDLTEKLDAIELFDKNIVGPMLAGLARFKDFRVLALCDHFTPITVRTHTREPVPFVIYPFSIESGKKFSERDAASAGVYFEQAHHLIDLLLA